MGCCDQLLPSPGHTSLQLSGADAEFSDVTTQVVETTPRSSWSLLRESKRILAWLPEGRSLPEHTWAQRHRMIVRFALVQAIGVGLFGVVRGYSLTLCFLDALLVGTPAVLALYKGVSRRARTISATVSLMFASATIVDLAGGSDVAHFHFFVMVAVVALYQDWTAFGVCILITVVHHAVLGTIDPDIVYGDATERNNPVVWSFIHGAFVLAESIALLIAWKANEQQELSDALTRLPNRTAFVEQLEKSLADPDLLVSVLFIDIDNFKQINDSVGHHAGDYVLCYLGERLREVVREGDVVARLGGDEFAIYVRGGVAQAAIVATRLLNVLQESVVIDGRELQVHASIGVADSDLARSRRADDLLRDADLAMYLAKSSGRNRFVTYTAGVDQQVRQRAELATDIHRALEADELELHFQPIVTGSDASLVGVEALLRWRHPVRGLVPPIEFIPLAEETGDIREIGAWVLRTAAAQVAQWQTVIPGCEALRLAVNLSPVQMRDSSLVETITTILHASGLDPRFLTLEVTESMLLLDLEAARRQLHALRALGIRVAIDDFGTGYSSLSYLSRLPADVVKIDQSFVRDLANGSNSVVLVRAVIEMATALNLDVVAEGVEAVPQQVALNELGCPHSQGYLYSPAVPAAEFAELAANWPSHLVEIRGNRVSEAPIPR
jgi:diguanylate cyclase